MNDHDFALELIARFITDKQTKTKTAIQIKMISEGKRFKLDRMWTDEQLKNLTSSAAEISKVHCWLYAYCRDNQEKFGA